MSIFSPQNNSIKFIWKEKLCLYGKWAKTKHEKSKGEVSFKLFREVKTQIVIAVEYKERRDVGD